MAGRLRLHIGWSNTLGWYEGLRLLVAVNPTGVITGFGRASTKDRPLAETFFALLRREPNPGAPSVGSAAAGPYVSDKGFEGEEKNHRRWLRVLRSTRRLPAQTKGAQKEVAQAA